MGSFLRAAHPQKTAESVAACTGISVSTVAKWLERSSAPSAAHMGALMVAYGVEFLAAAYPGLHWAEAILVAARKEALEQQIARAQDELAALRHEMRGRR